jgi:hypothetical protein
MSEGYREILDESIKLELQVSDLYMLFYNSFPEDEGFWWKLALEEKNHASLIRSIRDIFQSVSGLPESMFSSSAQDIKAANLRIGALLETFSNASPSREEAFRIALDLEESAGELHYQKFMAESPHEKINQVFKQLNGEDKNHGDRIRLRMAKAGIAE